MATCIAAFEHITRLISAWPGGSLTWISAVCHSRGPLQWHGLWNEYTTICCQQDLLGYIRANCHDVLSHEIQLQSSGTQSGTDELFPSHTLSARCTTLSNSDEHRGLQCCGLATLSHGNRQNPCACKQVSAKDSLITRERWYWSERLICHRAGHVPAAVWVL